MLTIETICQIAIAISTTALIPFALFFYKCLGDLSSSINHIAIDQAKMGEALEHMKWMDNFADDQRVFNAKITQDLNDLKVYVARRQ